MAIVDDPRRTISIIKRERGGGYDRVCTWLPEDTVKLDFVGDWSAPLEVSIGAFNWAYQKFCDILGWRRRATVWEGQSHLVWGGTKGLSVQVRLVFTVENDVEKDMWEPVRKLSKWVLPRAGDVRGLEAPVEGRKCYLAVRIGTFLFFDLVVLTNVSPSFEHPYLTTGDPMAILVDIGFQTFSIYTRENVDALYVVPSKQQLEERLKSTEERAVAPLIRRR